MNSTAFQTILADARIGDLRRAAATSLQQHRSREDRRPRGAARWGFLSRAGTRRLAFAGTSRATWGPR